MKNYEQIILARKEEPIQTTGIRFFTPDIARKQGLGSLFDSGDDESKKYAVAVAIGVSGLLTKGALIDVNQAQFKVDYDYQKEIYSKIELLFK